MAVRVMAQQHTMPDNANTNTGCKSLTQSQQRQLANPMFHDFLGMKKPAESPVGFAPKAADSPSASASLGASSGGARGLVSTTSDLGSERQVGNHLEGIPFYGPRSDISGPEICNRIVGNKRSNPESAFGGSSRDSLLDHDSHENSQLIKLLRNGAGGERHRRSNDDEVFHGMQSLRPSSASVVFQAPSGSRTDANVSKWEWPPSMNVCPAVQYPPRGGQFAPILHQGPSNRVRDATAGPSSISQSAADEGSRTGIKGPGILSSINASSGANERTSSVLPSGNSRKSGANVLEPESLATPGRHGITSASRQMTIFYGGQAHVFDDVHPNKADIIMALAGSNGGSWSTTYSPKSNARLGGESNMPGGDSEAGMALNIALSREFRGRLSATGVSNHGGGSGEQMTTPSGGLQGSIIRKDTSNPVQAAEPNPEAKREL